MKKYFSVWKAVALNALQETFVNRGSNLLFFTGKVIRLAFMLLFLWLLRQTVTTIGGYSGDEMVVFFLVYQFIDTFAQVLYRGVYMFSHLVRTGEFDFMLLKPIHPLFRALTGKPDINDAFFLIPSTALSIWILSQLSLTFTVPSILLFGLLVINSTIIATALHILVLVIGVLTTEVDGVIWFYRDLSRFGQFPITIYFEPLRSFLYFVVPIGIMITTPAEALLSLTQPHVALLSFVFGILFLGVCLYIWEWSLTKYQSASS